MQYITLKAVLLLAHTTTCIYKEASSEPGFLVWLATCKTHAEKMRG